ncbi:diguanylate cyclase [Oleiagrimonas sp.]|jgi:diguanylate cyclase|uniref:diguanylate cyclase n=1 Tax=Oleiagrimonas sp. TaxID=2010330 RepID=UPI0026081F9F|nr:diguanylate cyclase [Oleiagrimonas sp.]MDA3915324.1 diguanylate cyclase [Oleiagrimonas sp.]
MPLETVLNRNQLELQYVEQTFHLRMLGLAVGALSVGAAFLELHAASWEWALLAVYVLFWPHLAYGLSRRAKSPGQGEHRSIYIDASVAGFLIALIHFSAVPSLTMVMVTGMTTVSTGGWRLMVRGLMVMLVGAALAIAITGCHWQPQSSMNVIVATIPLMVAYPVAVSAAINRLARKVGNQNRMLNELSRTDGLTTLPNRQHWQHALTLEFQRYLRTHRPATLVMLDLDGFKVLNDTYGHTTGDKVLRRVADILHENSRNIDTPGRFGGDELALVMPETDRDGARMLMERIRREVEREEFDESSRIKITVSIGLAEINRLMTDPLDWIKAADDALYMAKDRGRNRVCTAAYEAPPGASL